MFSRFDPFDVVLSEATIHGRVSHRPAGTGLHCCCCTATRRPT